MKAVIYARFSSDLQSDRSIDDQVAACRVQAERIGATITEVYADYAISGATRQRPRFLELLAAARERKFDVVIAEALDRLSRDQEDIAGAFKRLAHAGVSIETIAEGRITELHIGLKGTMNALFLKDMAKKVRRGQAGRAAAGKIPAGLAYGYKVSRRIGEDGELVRGERVIDEEQANVVRRIFSAYVAGQSPRQIAMELNADSVPSATGRKWSAASILGSRKRRTGLLCNEIYAGRLVWNVVAYSRDPDTGARTERFNPETDWTVSEVPELRIVDEKTWQAAQKIRNRTGNRPDRKRRPKRILSGLVTCGVCGGSMIIADANAMRCSAWSAHRSCLNSKKLNYGNLEDRVLTILREALLAPDSVDAFIETFRVEYDAGRKARKHETARINRKLLDLDTKIDRLVEAITDGTDTPAMRQQLVALEERRADAGNIAASLGNDDKVIELLPNLPDLYRQQVEKIHDVMSASAEVANQAGNAVRTLIDNIVATPLSGHGQWQIEIRTRTDALAHIATGGSTAPEPVLMNASPGGLEPPFTA